MPDDAPCNDISGVYPAGPASPETSVSLTDILLAAPTSARNVTLSSTADGALVEVAAGNVRRVLRSGVDFTCTAAGIALRPVTTVDVDLPPLGTAQEVTRYVLQKRGDGSLVVHRTATRSATAFGLPFEGDALPKDDLVWPRSR
jgi:hypothetical protein